MILGIYSVRDNAAQAFLPPFHFRNKGEAIRAFSTAVTTADHQFAKNRDDYVLWFHGEFDDNSGVIMPVEPVRVIGAIEVIV